MHIFSSAGSTPPVFLAATRGYHMVVEVFKRFFDTNFLIENKFQQTILHMVLKAGYNNKVSNNNNNKLGLSCAKLSKASASYHWL